MSFFHVFCGTILDSEEELVFFLVIKQGTRERQGQITKKNKAEKKETERKKMSHSESEHMTLVKKMTSKFIIAKVSYILLGCTKQVSVDLLYGN